MFLNKKNNKKDKKTSVNLLDKLEDSSNERKKEKKEEEEVKPKEKKEEKKKKSFQKPVDLRNPEVLDVNLVRDEIIIFFNWKKNLIISFLLIILACLFIYEISTGLDYWEEVESLKAEKIEKQIEELKKEVVELNNKANNALLFKEKSLTFSKLLDNHIYWSNFFKWLENNTLNTVKYSGFNGTISGFYSLTATAPTYAEASWQAKVLKESPYIKDVEISSVNLIEHTEITEEESGEIIETSYKNVLFTVNFQIEQSIFLSN